MLGRNSSYNMSVLVLRYQCKMKKMQTKVCSRSLCIREIALTLELLGRFGRFLDEDDRCNPPVLLIRTFFEAPRALN